MGRNVRFFRNACRTCHNDVGVPLLGMFAYGEFVYQTDDGRTYAYVAALTNPAWERVAAILRLAAGMSLEKNDGDIDVYQRILIRCADRNAERQYSTEFPLCPKCAAKITSYGDDVVMFDQYLDDVTWERFMALSPQAQVDEVLAILKDEEGQPAR